MQRVWRAYGMHNAVLYTIPFIVKSLDSANCTVNSIARNGAFLPECYRKRVVMRFIAHNKTVAIAFYLDDVDSIPTDTLANHQ